MKHRPPVSRRMFLKLTATVAAGAALAGCTPKDSPTVPPETPSSQAIPTLPPNPTEVIASTATGIPPDANTAVPSPTEATSTPGPTATATPKPAYLAVVHGPDPAAITRAAIDALGGITSFVASGYDVIVKPNICVDYHPPEYAATTNPTVVATLVSLCLEAGAKRVRVMDYPFGGTAKSAYAISGIADAVEAVGGEMHVMNLNKYEKVDIPGARSLTSVRIYPDILEADLLINVPIAKHHSVTRLTLGAKNLMGTIENRNMMHENLTLRIADLASLIRPALTVIDAVRILTYNGPTGGSLLDVKQTDTIIASRDMVAADSYAATLFRVTGADVGYVKQCAAIGLGTMDLTSIDLREITIE